VARWPKSLGSLFSFLCSWNSLSVTIGSINTTTSPRSLILLTGFRKALKIPAREVQARSPQSSPHGFAVLYHRSQPLNYALAFPIEQRVGPKQI
jgi:hypothetical protein